MLTNESYPTYMHQFCAKKRKDPTKKNQTLGWKTRTVVHFPLPAALHLPGPALSFSLQADVCSLCRTRKASSRQPPHLSWTSFPVSLASISFACLDLHQRSKRPTCLPPLPFDRKRNRFFLSLCFFWLPSYPSPNSTALYPPTTHVVSSLNKCYTSICNQLLAPFSRLFLIIAHGS